jgi:hypothetical protein
MGWIADVRGGGSQTTRLRRKQPIISRIDPLLGNDLVDHVLVEPGMAMPDHQTIVDVFEEVLGVPFDLRWTKKISIDVPVARRLAGAVTAYYKSFRLPEKDRGEMRPYLFHGYTTGKRFWDEYVRSDNRISPSRDTELLLLLKPFLLYAHGISFYDPLLGLLDYFGERLRGSRYEKAHLPSLAHLLFQYVKIADLIRHQIVVPISDEQLVGRYRNNDFGLSDREICEVTECLVSIPRFQREAENFDLNHLVGSIIKEQLYLSQELENRIDLYFPRESCVLILQGLLRAASERYSSSQIYEPFAAGIFADLGNLDTSRISIMDIITIRSENAFSDYRRVLQGILRRLQDQQGKFSDLETEFAVAARQEMAACDDSIKQLTRKSNVLKDTLKNVGRVLIGGATGAVGGLLARSPEIAVLGGAAGGALSPLYDILSGAWTATPNYAARASLRHHFLALHSGDSSGRD